jgi:ankyrin repeat protein
MLKEKIFGIRTNVFKLAAEGKTKELGDVLNRNKNRVDEAFNGSMPLHAACFGGHLETANLLIKCGARKEAKDNMGSTGLHIACARGNWEIVLQLLENGADYEARDNFGRTPFYLATYVGSLQTMSLLEKLKVNVNECDNQGWSPLHVACSRQMRQTFNNLMTLPVDLSLKTSKGNTALHFASRWGDEEVVRAILDKGAQVWVTNDAGDTPLHLACYWGKTRVALLLALRGADVDARNNMGRTAVDCAEVKFSNKVGANVFSTLSKKLRENSITYEVASGQSRMPNGETMSVASPRVSVEPDSPTKYHDDVMALPRPPATNVQKASGLMSFNDEEDDFQLPAAPVISPRSPYTQMNYSATEKLSTVFTELEKGPALEKTFSTKDAAEYTAETNYSNILNGV